VDIPDECLRVADLRIAVVNTNQKRLVVVSRADCEDRVITPCEIREASIKVADGSTIEALEIVVDPKEPWIDFSERKVGR